MDTGLVSMDETGRNRAQNRQRGLLTLVNVRSIPNQPDPPARFFRDNGTTGIVRIFLTLFLAAASLAAVGSRFDEAIELQRAGKVNEARDLLHSAAAEFRASADQRSLARALSMSGRL